jgi:hypothetical protein
MWINQLVQAIEEVMLQGRVEWVGRVCFFSPGVAPLFLVNWRVDEKKANWNL